MSRAPQPFAAAPRRAVGPQLSVDLDAIAENTRLFVRSTTGSVMAVVKADGFGHGAVDVARTALGAGATSLGVTTIAEALALRAAGMRAPILTWLNQVEADWAAAAAADIEVAVPSRDHLEAVVRNAPGARVHLHLDTGLARDGAAPSEWTALCQAARRAEQQRVLSVVGVMGHLSCADVPADPSNTLGRTRFAWAVMTARGRGLRPAHRHLAATSATLTDPLSHHTMSRIGAGLVGIDLSRTTELRPALTLTAPLVEVRDVRAGTAVGYGHTWRAPSATRLGLLPIGYADGLPRVTSGRAEVQVRGRRCPVVGRISMDMTVVDLGDLGAEAGEPVTVFGPGDGGEPTVRAWAEWADTIEHEIVTGLGPRLHRTSRTPAAPGLRSLS
jgi:alanine racemase